MKFGILSAMVCAIGVAGCGGGVMAPRPGPQERDPLEGAFVETDAIKAPVQTLQTQKALISPTQPEQVLVTGDLPVTGCPPGSVLVTGVEGQRSCAHTSARKVQVGVTQALAPATVEDLRAQANKTGEAVAYSDGQYTVTVVPQVN